MSEAIEKINQLLEGMARNESGRLSFHDQCAAFYLLHRGFTQVIVAKTFGVTQGCISTLARCLTNPRRYRRVGEEFHRLGPDEFGERYLTNDISDRLARFRMEAPNYSDRRRGLRQGRRAGPNPTADAYAGQYRDHGGSVTTIKWLDKWDQIEDQVFFPGWYKLLADNVWPRGPERHAEDDPFKPFLTSKQAYESICHPDIPLPEKISENNS